MDLENLYGVVRSPEGQIEILLAHTLIRPLTREQVLNLAAHLCHAADADMFDLEDAIDQIANEPEAT